MAWRADSARGPHGGWTSVGVADGRPVREKKSARERREQKTRAIARHVGWLLQTVGALDHRGSQPTRQMQHLQRVQEPAESQSSSTRKVCWFAAGQCRYGEACRYEHSGMATMPDAAGAADGSAVAQSQSAMPSRAPQVRFADSRIAWSRAPQSLYVASDFTGDALDHPGPAAHAAARDDESEHPEESLEADEPDESEEAEESEAIEELVEPDDDADRHVQITVRYTYPDDDEPSVVSIMFPARTSLRHAFAVCCEEFDLQPALTRFHIDGRDSAVPGGNTILDAVVDEGATVLLELFPLP